MVEGDLNMNLTRHNSNIRPDQKWMAWLAIPALTGALALAGCASGSSSSATTSTSQSGGVAAAQSSDGNSVSIVMLGGPSSDPFFSTIKAGANAAAAAYGSKLKLTYLSLENYDNMGPDMAKLEATAMSENPNVVVSTDWVPSAQDAGFKQMRSRRAFPSSSNNGGASEVTAVGAATGFIGTDDTNVGQIAAQDFLAAGAKDIVCVNTTPGSQNNEDRCKGLKATAAANGAQATELELPPTSFGNPSAVSQAIKAELLKNPNVDGIFNIGAADADSAALGIQEANDTQKVKLGNAGVSTNVLERIKSGTQAFAVDIEPYLQGYLAVAAAYQYVAFGLQYTNPTPTGPVTITSKNVDAAMSAAKLGLR